jgi:oxygen-independent coproporphyrinogen-3 oxidase
VIGVYVHLPFCPYICPYCDFAKWPIRRSRATRYLEALHAQIERCVSELAATIFLGGGTPNAYTAAQISTLVQKLGRHFAAPPGRREVSIEVNPELVADGDFASYAAAGINRVSIGVQSFDADEVRVLGRKHTVGDVARSVAWARDAGIRSISIDLMFAVPGQTLESWTASLNAAIALGVDHVSCYGLTIEEGTPYERWQAREPAAFFDDEAEAKLYDAAIRLLEAHGYEQYEISNFARPGHRCAHNQNYWRNGEYIGLGVGAASYRNAERSVSTRDIQQYMDAVESEQPIPSERECLSGIRAAGEAIMLALRTSDGVSLESFASRYGIDVRERYAPVVEEYTKAGMLELGPDAMRLTRRGRFLANDVCGAFVTWTGAR